MDYNQREKAVRILSNDQENVCNIKLSEIQSKFQDRWGNPNDNVLEQPAIPDNVQQEIDNDYSFEIDPNNMKIGSDSSPEPDFIIPRTIKTHINQVSLILAKLLTLLLGWNYKPEKFNIVLGFM